MASTAMKRRTKKKKKHTTAAEMHSAVLGTKVHGKGIPALTDCAMGSRFRRGHGADGCGLFILRHDPTELIDWHVYISCTLLVEKRDDLHLRSILQLVSPMTSCFASMLLHVSLGGRAVPDFLSRHTALKPCPPPSHAELADRLQPAQLNSLADTRRPQHLQHTHPIQHSFCTHSERRQRATFTPIHQNITEKGLWQMFAHT